VRKGGCGRTIFFEVRGALVVSRGLKNKERKMVANDQQQEISSVRSD
jgi:hypothetical protein